MGYSPRGHKESDMTERLHLFYLIFCASYSPTPINPVDCSLPGSSVHGIFQAKVLEWVAIAFSNLDSILKSRDITLLTTVHIVKVMVFPVVMYSCESWTIKKAEP